MPHVTIYVPAPRAVLVHEEQDNSCADLVVHPFWLDDDYAESGVELRLNFRRLDTQAILTLTVEEASILACALQQAAAHSRDSNAKGEGVRP